MLRDLKSIGRRTRASQAERGKLPFYLALGYLIWSILPHAAFLVHEHAGGSVAHTHLSFHDAGLRVRSAVAANPAELAAGMSETAEPIDSAASQARAASAEAVGVLAGSGGGPRATHPQTFKPENTRHGHFTEDDNILATGICLSRALIPVPHPLPVPASVLSPSLPYAGPATARGPPSRA